MSVAERLAGVHARIERAAVAAGRDPASVRLVAVSKTHGPEAVREAYAAGQRVFGESYAQELVEKAAALPDLGEIEWHFIGHLQTNKARLVARSAHVVHTVDSTVLARELRYRVSQRGFRVREVTVVTTLLDAELYSATQIAELYQQRWEIETNLRHLKQTLHMDVLRTKTVAGIHKELAMFAIVYNLVRLVMLRSATRQGVAVNRIAKLSEGRPNTVDMIKNGQIQLVIE